MGGEKERERERAKVRGIITFYLSEIIRVTK
jgi:hypothetical protein